MKLRYVLTVAAVFVLFSSFAQGKLSEEKRREFEAQKVAFFTQVLELTPQEATVFWPLYNEMFKKLREEEMAHWKEVHAFRENKVLTAEQAKAQTAAFFRHEQKMLDLKKEYYEKMMQVIPAQKVVLLEGVERKFHRQLFDKMSKCPNPGK